MLRVGDEAVGVLPHFGHRSHREAATPGAHARVEALPYQWFNLPNVRFFTTPIEALCGDNGIAARGSVFRRRPAMEDPNLNADMALYRLGGAEAVFSRSCLCPVGAQLPETLKSAQVGPSAAYGSVRPCETGRPVGRVRRVPAARFCGNSALPALISSSGND